jgi:HAD superfamily hydrolase (TIGR01509 family)
MALSAVIFDVDGTLIDTNAAHVQAWDQALKQHDYRVSVDRIGVEIGKGGEKLVPSILGEKIDRRDGDSLRRTHTSEFTKIAESIKLNAFASVEPLLTAIQKLGLKLALATSSTEKELQITQRSARVDWTDRFDVIATGDDARESKPAPAILEVAIKKLKLSPAQCVMIGDTPYDADAARDAGTVCFGVTCGGMNDEKTLRATGMRKVYRDPADINAHLDEAIRIASPGSAILTPELIETLMKDALVVARQGLNAGEVPIGCVIARGDGTIVARGHNELNASQNKTAHAEMVTFAHAAGKMPTDSKDLILVSTLEPCVMCLGASMEAAVDTILFGLQAPTDGGRKRVRPPVSPESQMPRILGGVLSNESRDLLKEFLKRNPANPVQVKFVRELVAMA